MSPQTAEKDAEDRQTKCRALNLEPFRAVISISIAQALSLNSPPPPFPSPLLAKCSPNNSDINRRQKKWLCFVSLKRQLCIEPCQGGQRRAASGDHFHISFCEGAALSKMPLEGH